MSIEYKKEIIQVFFFFVPYQIIQRPLFFEHLSILLYIDLLLDSLKLYQLQLNPSNLLHQLEKKMFGLEKRERDNFFLSVVTFQVGYILIKYNYNAIVVK